MHYHIEQSFLCPHCNHVVPVLFQSPQEVTVQMTGRDDHKGNVALRQFKQPITCEACGGSFFAFVRVQFYCGSDRATIYDTGEVICQEIGVEFTQPE